MTSIQQKHLTVKSVSMPHRGAKIAEQLNIPVDSEPDDLAEKVKDLETILLDALTHLGALLAELEELNQERS